MAQNAVQKLLAADLEQIVTETGYADDFTWAGTTYRCVLSPPDSAADLEEGGFVLDGDFQVKIPRADFNDGAGPFPKNGDRCTFDGIVYSISSTPQKPESAYYIFTITA